MTPVWLPNSSVIAVSPFENQSWLNGVLNTMYASQEADSVYFSHTQFIVHTLKVGTANESYYLALSDAAGVWRWDSLRQRH